MLYSYCIDDPYLVEIMTQYRMTVCVKLHIQ